MNDAEDWIGLGGQNVANWHDEHKNCVRKGHDDAHDSDFCVNCGVWRSEACGDPLCMYCKDRPANPTVKQWQDLLIGEVTDLIVFRA